MSRLIGPSDYTAHAGACSGGANGVYWLRVVGRVPGGLLVANMAETSKGALPRVERTVEPDLLYPLLRWSDVSRWRDALRLSAPAQDPVRRRGIDERVMRERYPGTFAYLSEFRERLALRVAYRRYQSRAAPFYSMYDVGPYTIRRSRSCGGGWIAA